MREVKYMSVRAKFKCTASANGVVIMAPVMSGSPENETFWKYTPGGSICLSISESSAAEQFVQGGEYYVDFTPAN